MNNPTTSQKLKELLNTKKTTKKTSKLKTINNLIMYKALTKSPDTERAAIATKLYNITMEHKKITEAEIEEESFEFDLFDIASTNEFELSFIESFLEQLDIVFHTEQINRKNKPKYRILFQATKAKGCYILTNLDYHSTKINYLLNKTLGRYKTENLPSPQIKAKSDWLTIDLRKDVK